jgi:hypothetical protein
MGLERDLMNETVENILIVLFVIVMFAAAVFAGLEYFGVTDYVPYFGPSHEYSVSSNWAGYYTMSNLQNPQATVKGVNGSWVVPTITNSSGDTFSAAWIGVGGISDHSLIQCGTKHNTIDGFAYYAAWYEMLPDYAVTIYSMNIYPGDHITASITLVDPASNQWSVYMRDSDTGQVFEQNFTYASSRKSAEWIMEKPDVKDTTSKLAMFNSVTFTRCQVTYDGGSGVINTFPSKKIVFKEDVIDKNFKAMSVSILGNNGSSFSVYFFDLQNYQQATARTVELSDALSQGLVDATVHGYSLQNVNFTLKSYSDEPLRIKLDLGTMFNASSSDLMDLAALSSTTYYLQPHEGWSWYVQVTSATMAMSRVTPQNTDLLLISPITQNQDLIQLLNCEGFGNQTFRVQQFAVWTITDNPTRDGYRGLGSAGNFTGPSDSELQAIKDLFVAAGISTQNYQAFG